MQLRFTSALSYFAHGREVPCAFQLGKRSADEFDRYLARWHVGVLRCECLLDGSKRDANLSLHARFRGRKRLGMVLADATARVRRYSIVNVWRSIKGPVQDTPLAVCDARTVMASDLVVSEVRYPRRTGEIYVATHSPLHRWSHFSAMDRHEALVFKQYDSQVSGVARFTLHAAFDLPAVPPDAPLRESIELRCLVVHDDAA